VVPWREADVENQNCHSLVPVPLRTGTVVMCVSTEGMGNALLSVSSSPANPDWNNLPEKHTAKQAKDLDELLFLVRSYGDENGNIGIPSPSSAEFQGKKSGDGGFDDISLPHTESSPPSKKKPVGLYSPQATKIYPEASSSTSQKVHTGRTLVSLR
jgi:hypothetical protein